MENLFITNTFLELSPNPLENITENINKAISKNEDLSVAILAGCKIEVGFVKVDDETKIVIRTVHKISILKNVDGRVISVIEK